MLKHRGWEEKNFFFYIFVFLLIIYYLHEWDLLESNTNAWVDGNSSLYGYNGDSFSARHAVMVTVSVLDIHQPNTVHSSTMNVSTNL